MPSSQTTNPPAVAQRWYSPRQAAAYSGFTISGIRQAIREGRLPAYVPRGSRVIRILVDDLDDMITADGRMPPTADAVRARDAASHAARRARDRAAAAGHDRAGATA